MCGVVLQIVDFGMAGLIQRAWDKQVGSTALYMAPEMVRAEQGHDHRVDVYAFGVLMIAVRFSDLRFG